AGSPAGRRAPRSRSRTGSRRAPSVEHDAPDAGALVHQLEGAIDLLERHGVRHQVLDLEAATHVPVDILRQLGATACAAEGRAAPHASRDEEEGPRVDLLPGTRDADDDRLAPALVDAGERLSHHL